MWDQKELHGISIGLNQWLLTPTKNHRMSLMSWRSLPMYPLISVDVTSHCKSFTPSKKVLADLGLVDLVNIWYTYVIYNYRYIIYRQVIMMYVNISIDNVYINIYR